MAAFLARAFLAGGAFLAMGFAGEAFLATGTAFTLTAGARLAARTGLLISISSSSLLLLLLSLSSSSSELVSFLAKAAGLPPTAATSGFASYTAFGKSLSTLNYIDFMN